MLAHVVEGGSEISLPPYWGPSLDSEHAKCMLCVDRMTWAILIAADAPIRVKPISDYLCDVSK